MVEKIKTIATNILNLIFGLVGGVIGTVTIALGICSIPLGMYYALINGSVSHFLFSFFIPFYGAIYAVMNWLS